MTTPKAETLIGPPHADPAIVEALRALPIRVQDPDDEAYFWVVVHHIQSAIQPISLDQSTIAGGPATPHQIEDRLVSNQRAVDELHQLASKLDDLRASILGLSLTADWALDPSTAFAMHRLLYDAPKLSKEIARAEAGLSDSAAIKGGRPRKMASRDLAGILASVFWALTCSYPTVRTRAQNNTAYGPFLDLVSAIFGIAGVRASPESQARAAVKTFNRMMTLKPGDYDEFRSQVLSKALRSRYSDSEDL